MRLGGFLPHIREPAGARPPQAHRQSLQVSSSERLFDGTNAGAFLSIPRIQERTPMHPLLYVAAAVFLAVLSVAVHAFLTAPEGYEDERGFHVIRSDDAVEKPSPTSETTRSNEPPYLSA